MVREMKKLRKFLDEESIFWVDCSNPPEKIQRQYLAVCRFLNEYPKEEVLGVNKTHFKYAGHEFSVVNGVGTKGGYNLKTEKNQGLLEFMDLNDEDFEPIPNLTAEEVMSLVKAY